MKIIGIVLIILQVMALMGGNLPSVSGGGAYAMSYYLGFFAPGIIGVILLVKAISKQSAAEQESNSKE